MMLMKLIWLLLLLSAPGALQAQEAPVADLVQETLAKQGAADFFVVLRDDPSARILAEAAPVRDHQARRTLIIKRLQTETFRSQNDLGYWLLQQGADYQHFWIVNQVLVRRGTPELLRKLRARKDVWRIDANPRVKLKLPPPPAASEAAPAAPAAVEWGVSRIKADQLWSRYGVRGQGIVVAVQDTGVMWEHEALKNQYRGWNGAAADHTYSWHDAIHSSTHGSICGADATEPCDDYGHGTHVTGTIAGYTLANQIGVAPGAKWIACRNMDNGFGTPATYLECFQWFLAPEGDPSQAPHIISNSWSCPPSEGCNPDTLESAVATATSAGIMVVVSNGNEGFTGCASTQDPPALYRQAFSVGATDSTDNLAWLQQPGAGELQGRDLYQAGHLRPRRQCALVLCLTGAIPQHERHLHGGAASGRGRGPALVRPAAPEGPDRSHRSSF